MIEKNDLIAELVSLSEQEDAVRKEIGEKQEKLAAIAGARQMAQHLLGKLKAKEEERHWPFKRGENVRLANREPTVTGKVTRCWQEKPEAVVAGADPAAWVVEIDCTPTDAPKGMSKDLRVLGAKNLERLAGVLPEKAKES